jgi:hypothetical protein
MGGRGILTSFGSVGGVVRVVVVEEVVKYGLSEVELGPKAQAAVGLGGYEPSNEVGVHS